MKKSFVYKLVVVALAVLLTGCGMFGAKMEPVNDRAGDTAASESYPFAMEYPSIDSEPVLKASAIEASIQNVAVIKAPSEVKSIWISFLEMQNMLTNKTELQFRRNIQTAFDNIKDYGLNTVVVQVRPFADALYDSDYFPWSYLITGTEGKDPGFDPLEIMVEEARARKLRIEAWVNPYRVRAADNKNALAKSNQARKWLDAKDDSVVSYNGIISYNPASSKAQNLIVDGVVEIVRKYDVDAIHIDDYFYPTTDKAFDSASYKKYTGGGGKLSLADWRRANVERLIKKMYAAIKEANRKVMFGISPQSSLYNNYHAHYLDVQKIAANSGYCDYICPQIYFGFENGTQPYSETLKQWGDMVRAPGVKLYVGLAAYKVGAVDSWAGAGKNEWVNNTDILKRMTLEAREYNSYGGIVLYRYDFLFNPPKGVKNSMQREAKNLGELLR